VDANVSWFSTVSQAAHVPVLMWQLPIGPFDFHFLGEGQPGMMTLSRFVSAGLGGMMWEQQGSGGDPDTFRGIGLATPPSTSPAGGTALDLRTRLAAYDASPPAWPAGSLCANGGADGGGPEGGAGAGTARDSGATGGPDGAGMSSGAGGGTAGASGSANDGGMPRASEVAPRGSGGCGCHLAGVRGPDLSESMWRLFALAPPLASLRRIRGGSGRGRGRVGGARPPREDVV
jgi:hypothetical protein